MSIVPSNTDNKAPKIPKAVIAQVPFGIRTIEGLMTECDAIFGIAVPQIVSLDLASQNNPTRDVQTYMGKGFKLVKWKTPINSNPVNVILLADFERLLRKLDKAGNKAAEQMVDELVGLSMHQLFSDAFGLKFEKEERQKWLTNRQFHEKRFHPLYTSWLKLDGVTTTYGTKVNELKTKAKLPLVSIDLYDSTQLQRLNSAEIVYDAMRRSGRSHVSAMELV
jgi:hypothetical protein